MSLTALPSSKRRRFVGILSATIALTMLTVMLSLIFPDHVRASTHPGGNIQNSVILNVDIARPAVVRIFYGVQNAAVTPHVCAAEHGSTFTESQYALGGVGSGTFISSHGDVLTAFHVVQTIAPGEFEFALLQDPTVAQEVLADIQTKCHETLDDTALVTLYQNQPQLFLFDVSHTISKLWLDTSYVGPYPQSSHLLALSSFTYTVLAAKPTYTSSFGLGDDVAIIHVNGLQDTPSVPVGDSNTVSPTDQLTLIGYPGNGDINHQLGNTSLNFATDFLTESINFLTVSAVKTNDLGDPVIQIGGNSEHGDSGGPALNAQGQIVGIDSFGSIFDPAVPSTYQNFPDGTGFLQASSSAQSLLTQAGIDTTPGTFQNLWRQALTDFAATSAGHWHKAVTELSAIQSSYPAFKGADDYLTYAQQQMGNDNGNGTSLLSGASSTTLVGIGLAALAGIALLVVVIMVIAGRSRAKPQAALVPVAVTAATSQAMPPQQGAAPYGYPTYPPSQPGYASPSAPPFGQQISAPPYSQPTGTSAATCVNGHIMQPNEVRCTHCGEPRAQG